LNELHLFAGIGGVSSADNFSDMSACAPSSWRNTLETCSCSDSATECSHGSPSGTTLKPSTEKTGKGRLTASTPDSHAKTSVCAVQEQDSKVPAPDCGLKPIESLAKWSPDTSSWRTRQLSLFGDSEEFSGTWPTWGMIQDGELLELMPPDIITSANAYGLLPTPIATDWKGGTTAIRKDTGKPREDQWRDYVKLHYGLTYPHPTHSELRMGFPEGWSELKPLEMPKFQQWQQSLN
jgi:hypothetical protein